MPKWLGCILMILGTCVGAGMLALPVVTAQQNFSMTLILLCVSWLLMTIGALSLLKVNLWLPQNTNLISMAEMTLGKIGKYFTWLIYLLLLYSLICAYLSGISDIFHALLAKINIMLPMFLSTIIALLLFASIVYRGIYSVDIVNRLLMLIKFSAFFLLLAMILPFIHSAGLTSGSFKASHMVLMVMITSFGYAIIIPSLRGYLNDNHKLLTRVVLVGSILPLLIYIAWIVVIQGLIPRMGREGLFAISQSGHANSQLMQAISEKIKFIWVDNIAQLFIAICAMTSFLGVSVSLTDFIADGLRVQHITSNKRLVYVVSFAPPLIIVLFTPGIFITALDYAGILCVALLIVLPLMMLIFGSAKRVGWLRRNINT